MRSAREYANEFRQSMSTNGMGDFTSYLANAFEKAMSEAYETGQRDTQRQAASIARRYEELGSSRISDLIEELPIKPYEPPFPHTLTDNRPETWVNGKLVHPIKPYGEQT